MTREKWRECTKRKKLTDRSTNSIDTSQIHAKNLTRVCTARQPRVSSLGSRHAVGLEPVQGALETVFCGLLAVAGAVIGVKGVGRIGVHHKL